MKGLFLKYTHGYLEHTSFSKISGYRFEGGQKVDCSNENKYVTNSASSRKVLKCKCGAVDWTDNGRFIGEYECNCCGQFVEVYVKQ